MYYAITDSEHSVIFLFCTQFYTFAKVPPSQHSNYPTFIYTTSVNVLPDMNKYRNNQLTNYTCNNWLHLQKAHRLLCAQNEPKVLNKLITMVKVHFQKHKQNLKSYKKL